MINMFGSFGRYAQKVRDGCCALNSYLNAPSVHKVEGFLEEKKPMFTAVFGSISASLIGREGFTMRSVAWLAATVGSGRLLRSAIPFLRTTCASGIAWLDRALRVVAVGERAVLITQNVVELQPENPVQSESQEPMALIERVDRTIDVVEQRLHQAENLAPVCRVAKKNLHLVGCVFAFMIALFCQIVSESGLARGVQGLAAAVAIVKLVGNNWQEQAIEELPREEELRLIQEGAPTVD